MARAEHRPPFASWEAKVPGAAHRGNGGIAGGMSYPVFRVVAYLRAQTGSTSTVGK